MVGTQNAHNVISISSDGKLCSWSLDMLTQPQDTLELQHRLVVLERKMKKLIYFLINMFQTSKINCSDLYGIPK